MFTTRNACLILTLATALTKSPLSTEYLCIAEGAPAAESLRWRRTLSTNVLYLTLAQQHIPSPLLLAYFVPCEV
ncbi:hypothetical protein IW262DRAFT_1336513 [Armillaria fumosa]|nr:hypothetical protein IW262DRAFT_1336513 [Armillaria fumosa]